MKICLLTSDYPSPGHPAFTFVEQLVNHLIPLGLDVTVIAPQSISHAVLRHEKIRPRREKRQLGNGIEYIIYRPYTFSFGLGFPILTRIVDTFTNYRISRLLNKLKPDVLYGHFWHNALKVELYAQEHKLPLFVACGEGDNALEKLASTLSDERKHSIQSVITGVISVSSENKRKCIEMGLVNEDKVIVLPNCVETAIFRFDKTLSIRETLGIKETDFVIVFCGDFEVRKGPDRLSNAISLLQDDSIKSIFIGRPVPGEHVDPKCNGVVFKGSVDHDKLPLYLNSADIFVLPTRKEGCCNAIVEALACGLPVISSNGAFNDDILDENNSIRVNPDNIGKLADAIESLKSDESRRKVMRDYSISRHSTYSLQTRALKIKVFIEQMCR